MPKKEGQKEEDRQDSRAQQVAVVSAAAFVVPRPLLEPRAHGWPQMTMWYVSLLGFFDDGFGEEAEVVIFLPTTSLPTNEDSPLHVGFQEHQGIEHQSVLPVPGATATATGR